MQSFFRRSLGVSIAIALSATGACGGGDGGSGGGAGNAGTGSTGTGANGNSGGSGNAIGIGGGINYDGGAATGNTGGLDDGGACAAETAKGEQVPLDLYIMLDSSGSMSDKTSTGPTKWDAVKQAITGFVNAPGSAGLGVGLQYFPLNKQGVPDSCTNNNQCGSGGPCLLKTCLGGTTLQPCTNNSQCGILGTCADLGTCTGDPNTFCAPIGSNACGTAGQCVALTSSFCTNATECSNVRYATPAVNIAALPGNAGAIISSMGAKSPNGNTPTGPALQGAIDHAKVHAGANPGHAVAVVLATDGLPTSCNLTNISQVAQLAQQGLAGTPSIPTFVIGVFAPTDTAAAQNLNTIASSGGTNTAFIINTSGNVTQQFLQALDQIKGKALPCEFKIPTPASGQTLDYGKVNVEVSSSSGKTSLLYVEDASKCDPTNGGWYYDVNPSAGTPTKIVVCPSTCTAFKGQAGAQVDVLIGCKTNTVPR
ncbi:MAG: VWA domain-containing protein [Polyangiaceae bacterium]